MPAISLFLSSVIIIKPSLSLAIQWLYGALLAATGLGALLEGICAITWSLCHSMHFTCYVNYKTKWLPVMPWQRGHECEYKSKATCNIHIGALCYSFTGSWFVLYRNLTEIKEDDLSNSLNTSSLCLDGSEHLHLVYEYVKDFDENSLEI